MTGIFKAYDIRGIYPTEIDEEIARKIGFAFAQYLDKTKIVVGHDMRDSSPLLARAFIEGALSFGTEVQDIGLATTPMLYYAIADGGFDGGAMITASHLPAQYNGVKLCREKAIPLSGDDGLPEVEAIAMAIETVPMKKGNPSRADWLGRYVDRVAGLLENPSPLTIVVDAGNGMGGLDTPRLLERLPQCKFIPMYMEPDGDFPHHVPNPILPETTVELQRRVLSEKADLGVAFDGDGDRCGFIDEHGGRIPSDLVIAALAEFFLRKSPGATVLYDLRASRAVPERIRELGGNPAKTRVGHSFVKQRMREIKAVFAGELSGHYYYREMGFIDNGIVSLVTMLNLIGLRNEPVSELIRPLQKYAQTGEVTFQVRDGDELFRELEYAYSDATKEHLDGLTIEYPDWWFNLRQSHTEPAVRLVMEANNHDTLEREQARLNRIIDKYMCEGAEHGPS